MCFNAFDQAADLDVLDHPILNFIYYLVSSRRVNLLLCFNGYCNIIKASYSCRLYQSYARRKVFILPNARQPNLPT